VIKPMRHSRRCLGVIDGRRIVIELVPVAGSPSDDGASPTEGAGTVQLRLHEFRHRHRYQVDIAALFRLLESRDLRELEQLEILPLVAELPT